MREVVPARRFRSRGEDGSGVTVVELFLRTVRLESRIQGDWLVVDVELGGAIDVGGIVVASLRLNDELPAAATETNRSSLIMRFPRHTARSLLSREGRLTLTGQLDDGLQLRGRVCSV